MDRRSFLKRCSLLPFVGSLAAVGDSGASKDKLSGESVGTDGKLTDNVDDVNYKRYYIHYDFETKIQTIIEDGEITFTRKFKEDPFVLFNPNPMVSYVIMEKYRIV